MQAFRDALQLQSNVGASAATAEMSTSHASADLLDAHAEAAIAAVPPGVLADAGCHLHTTSSGLGETSQPQKSSNPIAAAEKEEAGRAKQDAAAAKAKAERLKVRRVFEHCLAPIATCYKLLNNTMLASTLSRTHHF